MNPFGEPLTEEQVRANFAASVAAADNTHTTKTTLESKAEQALTANQTFLDLASPTNAQTLAQVKLLTRQNNALIRLVINKLDSTSGT